MSQPTVYLGVSAHVIPDGTLDLNTANITNATNIAATSINAITLTGALTGTAANSSAINTISDNSNTNCYM